uniref:(northern house mosquito) hypothetical protein n=1 Tax=Culex pipiens TaxID=7175 RepID=A0A8D8NXT9_CULPI
MVGRKKRCCKSCCYLKNVASSNPWSTTRLRVSTTMIRKSRSSSRCPRLRPISSQRLPSLPPSIAKSWPLMQCSRIRKPLSGTQQSVNPTCTPWVTSVPTESLARSFRRLVVHAKP